MSNSEIKTYIEKIVEEGDKKEMQALSKMLDEVIYILKDYDYEKYCDYKMRLYEMAYGKILTTEMADKWVKNMNPSAHWSKEETDSVSEEYDLEMSKPCAYAILNMLYSDYSKVVNKFITEDDELNFYIKMAEAWYYDPDAKESGEERAFDLAKKYIDR